MTVERGKDWGESGEMPDDVAAVSSDRAAGLIVADARRADRSPPPLLLTDGDLARTLGGGPGRHDSTIRTRLLVDIGAVLVDGVLHWFVAHVVARHSWLHGRVVVATNAAFLGRWNIAPRAHPGDGRLDILDADLPLGERLRARRRLRAGTHVPHPAISSRRVASAQLELDRPTPIRLDGEKIGTARTLTLRVEPDALEIWI